MAEVAEKKLTLPATEKGRRTRAKLIDAAEAVFGELGYDRASIVAITRRAGVAQGTFYVYFEDKKAIFVELVYVLSHRIRSEIAVAVLSIDDRLDMEWVGYRAFFDVAFRDRNLYKILRQSEFVDEDLYRSYYEKLVDGYIEGITQAMENGQMRPLDPETVAWCLMAMADFIGMRWILWEGEKPPERAFETVMALIQSGLHPVGRRDKEPIAPSETEAETE